MRQGKGKPRPRNEQKSAKNVNTCVTALGLKRTRSENVATESHLTMLVSFASIDYSKRARPEVHECDENENESEDESGKREDGYSKTMVSNIEQGRGCAQD